MDKENLSIRQINEILSELAKSEDKQLMYDEQFIKQLYDNYKKIITDISDESYNNLKKDLYNQNIIIKSAGVNQDVMVKPDVDDSKVTVSDDNRIYKGTVIWVNSLAKDITISLRLIMVTILIMYLIKKNSRILLAQMKLVIIHYIY